MLGDTYVFGKKHHHSGFSEHAVNPQISPFFPVLKKKIVAKPKDVCFSPKPAKI